MVEGLKKLTPTQVATIADMAAQGKVYTEIAKVIGCNPATISKVLKRLRHKAEVDEALEWIEVTRTRRKLKPCGTNAAYQRHRKRGEKCWLCSAAHAEEIRLWKQGQSPSQLRKSAEYVDEKSA